MAPNAYNALLRDPDWKASHALSSPDKICVEVDALAGIRVVRSNAPGFLPYTGNVATGTSTKVYSSFVIGRYSYQISDLQNLRVYGFLVARLTHCNSPASWVGSLLSRRSSPKATGYTPTTHLVWILWLTPNPMSEGEQTLPLAERIYYGSF